MSHLKPALISIIFLNETYFNIIEDININIYIIIYICNKVGLLNAKIVLNHEVLIWYKNSQAERIYHTLFGCEMSFSFTYEDSSFIHERMEL